MNPFYNFQSYPNKYYTKLRGTPPPKCPCDTKKWIV